VLLNYTHKAIAKITLKATNTLTTKRMYNERLSLKIQVYLT